jgi:signal transduction histidine kinase/ActR/RegA family two-component response regulator
MGEEGKRPPTIPGSTDPADSPPPHPHHGEGTDDAIARIERAQQQMELVLRRNEIARENLALAPGTVQSALRRGSAVAGAADPAPVAPAGRRGGRGARRRVRIVADPLELVLEQSCLLAGAAAGLVFELSRTEDALELVCATGMPPDTFEAWRRLPISAEAPASDAVRSREPIAAGSWPELAARYPALSAAASPPLLGASIALPLMIDGLCSGALELFFREDGAFTRDELSLLRPVALRIARCLESVALVKRDRQSRARLYMLAEASRMFSAAGPDVSSVLGAIANQVLVGFASSCSVSLASPDGQWLEAALVRDRDPEHERRLRQMAGNLRVGRGEGLTGQVLATGRSILFTAVAPGELGARTVPSIAEPLEVLGVKSLLVVPLGTSGRMVGTIAVCRYAGDGPFTEDDRVLLEDLGDRAAMAIENARLHQVERAARARAEEADRRKDEFLAVLSHELRNPLAPLHMGVELIRKLPADDEGGTWAREMIARQVGQLSRLVGDLLDVSRINLGRIDLCLEATDLAGVASAALEAMRPQLVERGHTVAVDLPPNPVLVRGDAARLTQVITNLLDNAAKYTDRGGRIAVSVASAPSQATVTVEDSGMGIPPEMLDRIFDPFTRLEAARDQPAGGLGIGLTLVKQLVEIQNGSVRAYSEGPGRGSRFVLGFPLLTGAREQPAVPASRPPEDWGPGISRRILVVEDNADAAESLRLVLLSQGHQVHVLHDGVGAAETVERLHPDVVLLDIGLPGLDGLEVARRVRQRGLERQPLLVATTGLGRDEDRARSAQAGFDHHLVKPIDVTALRSLLERAGPDASPPGGGSAAGTR